MNEKRFPLYIPIIMITIVVLLCKNDLQSKETAITSYIMKNQEELCLIATDVLHYGTDRVSLIDGINGLSCWNGEETMVDFQYYSVGFGQTTGTRYGFYYSPQDTPTAYEAKGVQLIHDKNGWTWTCEDESSGYTKKIMDNWYYYEVTF